MELLFSFILELLAPLLTAAFSAIFSIFAPIITITVSTGSKIFGFIYSKLNIKLPKNKLPKNSSREKTLDLPEESEVFKSAKKRLIISLIRRVLAGIVISTIFLFMVVLIINTFFFKPVFRYVCDKVESSKNMTIEYSDVDGSIFTGVLNIENLKISAETEFKSFDIELKELSLNYNILSSLSRTKSFSHIDITDARIESKEIKQAPKKVKSKKHIDVKDLSIKNLNITHTPFKKKEVKINIAEHHSEKISTSLTLFYLLFRSNSKGTINGVPYSIEIKNLGNGRETIWQSKNMDSAILQDFFEFPFTYCKSGKMDIYVYDRWERHESSEIDMRWNVTIKNFKWDDEKLTKNKAIRTILKSFEGKELPIQFQVKLSKGNFEYASSMQTTGLFKAVSESFFKSLTKPKLGLSDQEDKKPKIKLPFFKKKDK